MINLSNFEMLNSTVRSVVKLFRFTKPFGINGIYYQYSNQVIRIKGKTNYVNEKFVDFFRNSERYSHLTFNLKGNHSAGTPFPEDITVQRLVEINSINYNNFLCYLLNLNYMEDIEHNRSSHVFLNADERCSKELCNISRELVYKSIDVWYTLYRGNIITKKVYLQFLNLASTWLHSNKNEMEEIVYIMFYASLLKSSPLAQNIIKMCLIQIERSVCHLTPKELCIVINSSFKASVKIKSKNFLKQISQFALENLKFLTEEPEYLVAVVKGLRFAKYHDFRLLDAIGGADYSNYVLNMIPITKIHILALYADALYYKKPFVKSLIQSCLKDFSSESAGLTEILTIRLKDVSRLLWALSYLNHNPSPNDVIKITAKMQTVMHEGNRKNADHIASCLLSLWMLRNKSPALFNTTVINNLLLTLKARNVFRSISRLCLLLTCIQIEMPGLLKDDLMKWDINNILPLRAQENQLKKRELLHNIYIAIENLSKNMNIHVIYGCFVPNLNIVGITVQSSNGKIMQVEVLDSTTCLYKTSKPHGIMKLKLNLLQCLRQRVLVIPENKFDVNNSDQLYIFLDEQLRALEQTSHQYPEHRSK